MGRQEGTGSGESSGALCMRQTLLLARLNTETLISANKQCFSFRNKYAKNVWALVVSGLFRLESFRIFYAKLSNIYLYWRIFISRAGELVYNISMDFLIQKNELMV